MKLSNASTITESNPTVPYFPQHPSKCFWTHNNKFLAIPGPSTTLTLPLSYCVNNSPMEVIGVCIVFRFLHYFKKIQSSPFFRFQEVVPQKARLFGVGAIIKNNVPVQKLLALLGVPYAHKLEAVRSKHTSKESCELALTITSFCVCVCHYAAMKHKTVTTINGHHTPVANPPIREVMIIRSNV